MLFRVMDKRIPRRNLKAKTNTLIDWGELLSAVCKRPQMYVASSSLRGVLDFLSGYLYAQSLLYPETESESEWRQFNY
jgi:hypothetical protein